MHRAGAVVHNINIKALCKKCKRETHVIHFTVETDGWPVVGCIPSITHYSRRRVQPEIYIK